jgi:capsule polysaccharide modification protein KpsS
MATKKLSDITTGVDLVDAERQFKVLQTLLVAKGKSKYKQSEEHLPDVGKYIFLPMQVITDTVAKLSHIDGLTLLKILSDWAPSSRYKIIVKRHPLCHSRKVAEALKSQAQAGKIILSKASIHDLIGGADCVVTVNSGVGAEALVHLKPVITTGGSDYAAATTLVKTKEDLIAALNAIPDGCVDENEVKRFLWHYSKRYQIEPSRDPRSVSARVRELLSSGVFA